MTNDEKQIRELIASWHHATAAGDVDAILGLMSADVVFLRAGQPPLKGRAEFEKGIRELLASHKVESHGTVVEVAVSGDLAYAWSNLDVSVLPADGGPANRRSGAVLSVFQKQKNGSWVLTRDANLLS